MTDGANEAAMFQAAFRAPGDKNAVPAGVLAVDAEHRLRLVSAEPELADRLAIAVSTLNGRETFTVRAAPQPGDAPLSLRKRRVPRDAPEARSAMLEMLRKTYGLELTPTG
ncbi:MAG TPA: hypothetical protein VMU82_07535 [Acetobacteraceae bacterium]|nr:hypothetical protein [Acetobacteraceae bacterium]